MKNLCVLIMAAGKGTRMVSEHAKVLHTVCGKPMLRLVHAAAAGLDPERVFVVIGHDADRVRASLEGSPVEFVLQAEQLGTGHAVMAAAEAIAKQEGDILILPGDAPLIRTETLATLAQEHRRVAADLTMLTVRAPDPAAYGRIVRNLSGEIERIVEAKDAGDEEKRITEVNPGFYCYRIEALLDSLQQLSDNNAQREYYVTDLVEIQKRMGRKVKTLLHHDFQEVRGINSRSELADVSALLRIRKNRELMAQGVTLIDPGNTFVDLDVAIARDVTLHPMVTIEGGTQVGEGTVIHSGTRIVDSRIGNRVHILDCCLITESAVGDDTTVGPFAHVRKETAVGSHCRIGNFVEIKKSRLDEGVKAAHLAYLGDAEIGRNVNIGAGTITCNYDGIRKNPTVIEEGAFIGTDSQLVAPVRVGRGAYVAAGSCITEDVPPDSLAIARSRQTVKEGWARRRKDSH